MISEKQTHFGSTYILWILCFFAGCLCYPRGQTAALTFERTCVLGIFLTQFSGVLIVSLLLFKNCKKAAISLIAFRLFLMGFCVPFILSLGPLFVFSLFSVNVILLWIFLSGTASDFRRKCTFVAFPAAAFVCALDLLIFT